MEENKNIELNEEQKNFPDETVPQAEQPSALNLSAEALAKADPQPSTTQEMEVHHHSHQSHGKKNWKTYFWEFLMLFLAVFCGFLAEYQLEHVIENSREIILAESLLEDIKKDTADLNQGIPYWDELISTIDTIQAEIDKPVQERNPLLLYRSVAFIRSYDNFEYHDRTIQQLKNGGNFRLIRKKAVANSLIDYDAEITSQLRDQEMQSNAIYQELNFLQDKLFNSKGYKFRNRKEKLDSLIKSSPLVLMTRYGKEDELFEYYNHLDYYRLMNKYRNGTNKRLLKKADSLIIQIKTAYHLK